MRYIFVSIILAVVLEANYVRWMPTYDMAHAKALQEKKGLFVLLVENYDEAKQINYELFTNKEYVESINENFVCVIINKDQTSSYPIELLYTLEYPAMFFLNTYELFACKAFFGLPTQKQFQEHLKLCY